MDNNAYDIAYNGVKVGNCFFHYFNYTDSKIIEYYKANGDKLINDKQGYTKCSVAIINENAIITSDTKIAKIIVNGILNKLQNANILLFFCQRYGV